MVERIRLLLETRQLTPTQFADAIGVARPIVSHILSGRNKPSLDVVQRILAAMPDLSMPWLLNGSGPMLAALATNPIAPTANKEKDAPLLDATINTPSASASSAPQPRVEPAQVAEVQASKKPSEPSAKPPVAFSRPAPPRFAAKKASSQDFTQPPQVSEASAMSVGGEVSSVYKPATSIGIGEPPLAEVPLEASSELPVSQVSPPASLFASTPEKQIRRIVIFYKDGSFADYQPE